MIKLRLDCPIKNLYNHYWNGPECQSIIYLEMDAAIGARLKALRIY